VFTWLAVIAVAGSLLSCAFVIAARQHFESISIGYQTEEMRKQSTQLDERLRQLELEYSRAASPFEIERKAAQLGLVRPEGAPGKSHKILRAPASRAPRTANARRRN
jgi:hypothetical protein